jgi:hypothetical protein
VVTYNWLASSPLKALSLLTCKCISLEMPVTSQGHYGFHNFPLLTDFVSLYTYEF